MNYQFGRTRRMTPVKNLRGWREYGLCVQRERERQKLSVTVCAEQLGASAQMVLDLESANVFSYADQGAELGDIAKRYSELLGIPTNTFATLLLDHTNVSRDEESYVPVYLRAKS